MDTGFPAHAGMDPGRGRDPAGRHRFPRTRGDGPYHVWAALRSLEVSPHTRGWTPFLSISISRDQGFPRTRGDGPVSSWHS